MAFSCLRLPGGLQAQARRSLAVGRVFPTLPFSLCGVSRSRTVQLGRPAFAGDNTIGDDSGFPGQDKKARNRLPASEALKKAMETVPLLPAKSVRPSGSPSPNAFDWKYLVALCTLSVVICYADRSNISTAVLPMAEQFGWDKTYQGVVLSVFFSGYATTQILGGGLADRFGGKLVLAAGVALWSLFTFMTPAAAASGTFALVSARVMLGVGEGVAFPSIHSLISRNVPSDKQSTAVGIVTAASYAGTALAFGISPLIISKLGWEWVFYLFASMALLWLPLWVPVKIGDSNISSSRDLESAKSGNADDTASTTGDSDDGGLYLDRTASAASTSRQNQQQQGGKPRSLAASFGNLGALLKRREVWAICAAQYAQSWGMYGLLNWLPTFFSDYYHIELADLGSYTLLPYVVQGGLGCAAGVLADNMLTNGWDKRTVRTLFQVVGMVGPAACLLLAVSPAVGASASFASNLITVGLGFSALTLGGVSASHLDIAPRNAGLVFGAGNTSATLAGLISVPFTGFLLQATNSWPLVFGVTAVHYLIGAAVWAMWVGDKPLLEDSAGSIDVEAEPAK